MSSKMWNELNSPCNTDLETFLLDNDFDRYIITYWKKKDIETQECAYGSIGRIKQWIEMPNKDIMVGIVDVDECNDLKEFDSIQYFMLSEIQFEVRASKQNDYLEEEEEEEEE